MTRYFRFVLKHRVLVLVVCGLLSLAAAWSLTQARLATSLSEMFFGNEPEYQQYIEWSEQFGSDEQLIVAFRDPDLLKPASLARLRRISDELSSFPGIKRVYSVADVLARAPGNEAALELVEGLLLSEDRRHAAVVVEFSSDHHSTLEHAPAVVDQIVGVFEREGFSRSQLNLAGIVVIAAELHVETLKNLVLLTPLVGAVLLLVTYLLLGRLWPVLLALAIAALSILWTLGFTVLLNREVNVLVAMAPSLIVLVAFADLVHLYLACRREVRERGDREAAIQACAVDVGTACFYTSLTTFIGFVGLSLVSTPAIRQLGIVLGFGVGVTLLLTMTLAPIAFLLLPSLRVDAGRHAPHGSLLNPVLGLCYRVATRHPRKVIASFAGVLALAVFASTRIDVETDLVARMSAGSRLRTGIEYVEQHFAGAATLDLYVEAEGEGGVLEADVLAGVARLQDELEKLPEVGRVLSVCDVLAGIGRRSGEAPVPGPGGYAGAALLLRLLPPKALARLVSEDRRSLHLTLLLKETGVRAIWHVGERARQLGERFLAGKARVEPSGILYVAGAWLDRNVDTQKRAIYLSFGAIALAMMLAFRSLRTGLLSMVPNLLPLFTVGALLWLMWDKVDSDAAMVALVAIGIAVDDTIHFLHRHRVESRRQADVSQALERTFAFAGRGILVTSLIFMAGMAPFALSDYLPIRMLGLLLPAAMAMAVLADLLLLPAMLRIRWIR